MCIIFVDIYHNYNEVVEPILQLFSIITSQLLCYLSEVCSVWYIGKLCHVIVLSLHIYIDTLLMLNLL